MTAVSKLGYITVGVTDINEAIEFYTRFVRLDVTARSGSTAFLTGGLEHHWIRIEECPAAGIKRIAYALDTEAEYLVIRDRLKATGIPVEEGGDIHQDKVQRWLRFVDPGGMPIELYTGMVERGIAPMYSGIAMQKFLHAAWATANFDATTDFYQDVLGFRVSDWVETRAGFFRSADRYHHSLVLIRAERPVFNHFCIQVESLDDVMRARHNAVAAGVKLRDDLLRHAPSGSVGVYLKDEARKFSVEFCTGHPQVEDDHQARILPSTPETINVWTTPLPYTSPQSSALDATWAPGAELTIAGITRPSAS
jgi:2,3-dihydroxy-p-cumate/2,3-dihydroxybenzoate 3,4-dioxygenase